MKKWNLIPPLFLFLFFSSCMTNEFEFQKISPDELDLAGTWSFQKDPDDKGIEKGFQLDLFNDASWGKLRVPATWDSQNIGLGGYDGIVWNRRKFTIPMKWECLDLSIDLGKVDDAAICFINGEKVGQSYHFEDSNNFTIPSRIVRFGMENTVSVKITDTGGKGGIAPGPVAIRPILPWDSMNVSFKSPDETHVYRENSPVNFEVIIDNVLDADFTAILHTRIDNIYGEEIRDKTERIECQAGKKKIVQTTLGSLPKSYYNVSITLKSGDVTLREILSSFVVLGPPITFRDSVKSPFAVCGGGLFHLPIEQHTTEGDVRLRQIDRLGVRWGRNDIWWSVVEQTRGTFDWTKADSSFSLFKNNNIHLLPIICYSTEWLDGKAPVTDEERKAFASYAFELVKRYRNQIRYWEVWNEPNAKFFWRDRPDPKDYTALLKETYTAIKKADPEAKVVGGVTAGTDLGFIRGMINGGAAEYMDVISVHPYQEQPPDSRHRWANLPRARTIRSLLDRSGGRDVSIWYTECGWSTIGEVTEEKQVENLVKYYVVTLAEGLVEKIYWFNLTDWGPRGSSTGGHFGLAYQDHSPKPSLLAYYVVMENLKDFDSASIWNTGVRDTSGFVFTRGEERIYVAWSKKGEEIITIPEGCKKAINVYGREKELDSKQIKLNLMPVYFR